MAPQTLNVLVSAFSGLKIPQVITVPSAGSVSELTDKISTYFPPSLDLSQLRLIVNEKKQIRPSSEPISTLCNCTESGDFSEFLRLRLSIPLCGGKGGFGSQLRAAGGRMSSQKKGKQGDNNASNRNLDGRRLRVVDDAKALTEYLALKPGMERRKRKAQLERCERIVAATEKRKEELTRGEGHGKIEGHWVEEKEDAREKTRDAVLRAVKGNWKDRLPTVEESSSSASGGSASPSSEDSDNQMQEDDEDDAENDDVKHESMPSVDGATNALPHPQFQPQPQQKPPKFFGFDDVDDELLSDED